MTDRICQQFDDYHAGRLSTWEEELFARHALECQRCQVSFQQMRSIEEDLRRANDSIECREEWSQALLEQVRNLETDKRNWADAVAVEMISEPPSVLNHSIDAIAVHRGPRSKSRLLPWCALAAVAALLFVMVRFQFFSDAKTENPILQTEAAATESVNRTLAYWEETSLETSSDYISARIESDRPDIEIYVIVPKSMAINSETH